MRDAAARGKYAPLYHYLISQGSNDEWHTSFRQLESILGFRLPNSARLHRPWWANPNVGNGHSHALAWQAAGWRTRNVDIDAETLVFAKIDARGEPNNASTSSGEFIGEFLIEDILPPHDAGPWPPGLNSSREEMYGEKRSPRPLFLALLKEPSIQVRLRASFSIEQDDDSFYLQIDNERRVPIGTFNRGYVSANETLASGAPLAALRDQVIADSDSGTAGRYLPWLKQLAVLGVIEFPLVDEIGEQAVLLPQRADFVPTLAPDTPSPYTELHRFACLRRAEGAWLIEMPMAGARLRVKNLQALETSLVRRALSAAGFLDIRHKDDKDHQLALQQWEFHDLIFHAHHRNGWHRDPKGDQFPFIGKIAPLPAVRAPWPGQPIPLKYAPERDDGESFASILGRRRSERSYDESRLISLEHLGALLDRAARIQALDWRHVSDRAGNTEQFETSQRPYPSGGASYELEIYPVVNRCDGLAPGMYHYDPQAHHLVQICERTGQVDYLLKEARACTGDQADPQVLLIIAARFARVMWKYRSNGYSIILRNAGALYQTLYLAATELGLSPCALGGGDSAVFAEITGLDPVIEGSVGEFILGGPPQQA